MPRVALVHVMLAVAMSAAVSGCFSDPRACDTRRQCFDGEACRNGFCVDLPDDRLPRDGRSTSDGVDTAGDDVPCESPESWFRDRDGDGYGDPDTRRVACTSPGHGWISRGGDCDDGKASIHPGATEQCDDVDRNCNGVAEEQPCPNQTGVCEGATGECGADGPACGPDDYGEDYSPEERRADGLDNDCDGVVDDAWRGVALGAGIACGLQQSGEIHCWGDAEHPVVTRAPEGEYTDVAVGSSHACAVDTDGNVVCWGGTSQAIQNREGEYAGVAAGVGHSCAIAAGGGDVECWGRQLNGATAPPAFDESAVLDVAAGLDFTCARLDPPGAIGWGLGSDPDADEGERDFDQAVPDPEGGDFTAVAAGRFHACALERDSGGVECWGAGTKDESDTGAPHFEQSVEPEADGWKTLAAGWHHTCGVNAADEVVCWGRGGRGPAVRADGPFAADGRPPDELAAGRWGTCAVEQNGELECWGSPRGPGEPTFSP